MRNEILVLAIAWYWVFAEVEKHLINVKEPVKFFVTVGTPIGSVYAPFIIYI